jgi:Patatin-like phospholipase
MGHKKFTVFLSFLALLLLAACTSPPERVLSSNAPSYATLPNGYEPLNPTRPSPIYAAETAVPGDNLVRYLERKRGHALNILSLSGGGQNGAFGAGFLVGWRESGRRPQFDIVGGVSTGALLATHALLGTLPTMRRWKRCTRESRKTISTRIEESSAWCPVWTH